MFRILKNMRSFDVLKLSYINKSLMKQVTAFFFTCLLSGFGYTALAQDETKIKDKKKTEEIIIRKTGEKDVNITIQINGDKVLINGKPITEFKDENISVNKRNITVWDGDHLAQLNGMGNFEMQNFGWNTEGGSKVVLGVNTEKVQDGAMITDVTKGSAAEKAGLLKGDIITSFGGTEIEDSQDLYDAVNKKKANDEVKVDYLRSGKAGSAKAIIQERKEKSFGLTTPSGDYKAYTIPKVRATPHPKQLNPAIKDLRDHMDFAYAFSGKPKLGLKIQDTDDEKGVKVIAVEENSASGKAGLKTNDVITEIGGQKVMNTDDAREALMDNESSSNYKIKVKRNGADMAFDIKILKKLKTANL